MRASLIAGHVWAMSRGCARSAGKVGNHFVNWHALAHIDKNLRYTRKWRTKDLTVFWKVNTCSLIMGFWELLPMVDGLPDVPSLRYIPEEHHTIPSYLPPSLNTMKLCQQSIHHLLHTHLHSTQPGMDTQAIHHSAPAESKVYHCTMSRFLVRLAEVFLSEITCRFTMTGENRMSSSSCCMDGSICKGHHVVV